MHEIDQKEPLHIALNHMLTALAVLDQCGEEFVAAKLSLAVDVLNDIITACERQPDA